MKPETALRLLIDIHFDLMILAIVDQWDRAVRLINTIDRNTPDRSSLAAVSDVNVVKRLAVSVMNGEG